jgi:carbon storage regulator CsrA
MLVLSRKAGQRIHIGDEIVVEIRRVAGNRVTIALEAPRDVRILRGELQQAATEFEVELGDAEVENEPTPVRIPHTATPHFAHLASHLASNEMVG